MEFQDPMAPGLDPAPPWVNDPANPFGPFYRPGVTVCIAAHPARLRNGMLSRAFNSVIAQTQQPEVILVVNDTERHGAGWTRSVLLDRVDTEWIAWIDSDDEWEPEHLAKLVEHARATDSVFVYSWFHGNDPLGHMGRPFDPCRPHHTTMAVLVRTDIANRVGFYPSSPGPFSNEDWLFIVGVSEIACREGLTMSHLPEKTWHYHQQGQNTSGQPTQGDAR